MAAVKETRNPILQQVDDKEMRVTVVRAVDGDGSSATMDAFGRQRVSNTGQRLDVEFIYDKQEEFFDEITNNGAVTFNANSRDLTLSISDTLTTTYSNMRSHPVPYTPGNSQLIDITGVLDLAGVGGGNAEVFLRSKVTGTVTEEVIEQADWLNLNSGVDWTKSHILAMDFQSLKVGRIRYFLVGDGRATKIAEIVNDNKYNTGYWQVPSLPVYWKLYNDATYTYMEMGYGNDDNGIGIRYKTTKSASCTMKAICCTVKSEGGYGLAELPGLPRAVCNNVTPVSVSTTLVPVLSIRAKDLFKTYDNLGIALPKAYDLATNNKIKFSIIHDGVLTGASWADVDTESMMEYDVSATAITGGHVIDSGYVTTSVKNSGASGGGLLGKTVVWNRLNGFTGIITIAAIRTTTSDADVYAAIRWDEIR